MNMTYVKINESERVELIEWTNAMISKAYKMASESEPKSSYTSYLIGKVHKLSSMIEPVITCGSIMGHFGYYDGDIESDFTRGVNSAIILFKTHLRLKYGIYIED